MSDIMSTVGSLVSNSIDWVGDFVDLIVGQPLLLTFVVLPLVGLGVGFISRLIHTRG